jgi:hypothetical protein
MSYFIQQRYAPRQLGRLRRRGMGVAPAGGTTSSGPPLFTSRTWFGPAPIAPISPITGVPVGSGPIFRAPYSIVGSGAAPVTTPVTTTTATGTTSGAPAAQGSSPVPVGYSTNQIYVAPDGTWWEYSPSQSAWVNVSAAPAAVSTALQTAAPLTTSGIVPVPVGQSTAAPYIAEDGSIWVWNASSGTWQEVYGANATLAAAYATGQTEIASDGSVWTYSSSTGQWTQISGPNSALASASAPAPPTTATPTVAVSDYQSVLNWLQTSTLIPSVPNWIVALGAAVLLYKVSQPSGKK